MEDLHLIILVTLAKVKTRFSVAYVKDRLILDTFLARLIDNIFYEK